MKTTIRVSLAVIAMSATALAVKVGDTFQQVIAEKGNPPGKLEMGATQILQYPDQWVKMKDGKVTSVESKRAEATVPAGAAHAGNWTTDYKAALQQAKAENRHVFLFFTGSDWCGWCMRLQKEILTKPEFTAYAGEKLVLVELDFPHRRPIAPALKAQNQELARKFGIQGYPTVIVLNSAGKKVAEMGYQEGGPKPFVGALKKL
ncbi:MAG: thioredoxin family protein [Verrucomicrobiales bacterium]